MNKIIGLKDLRLQMDKYITKVREGQSFVVVRKNQPIFKLIPLVEDGVWEEVIDFTKLKKGGIDLDELLARL